jgi:hypothetical protein
MSWTIERYSRVAVVTITSISPFRAPKGVPLL